jgi:hypothetical protein
MKDDIITMQINNEILTDSIYHVIKNDVSCGLKISNKKISNFKKEFGLSVRILADDDLKLIIKIIVTHIIHVAKKIKLWTVFLKYIKVIKKLTYTKVDILFSLSD